MNVRILCSILLIVVTLVWLASPLVAFASCQSLPSPRYFGFNVWYLATRTPEEIRTILNLMRSDCGTVLVRFWGYENTHGVNGYHTIGKVLDAAPEGMKFIVVLEDFPYGPPVAEPPDPNLENPAWWYKEGYKESFRDYVIQVLNRYGHRSEILVWEITNEPHCWPGEGQEECYRYFRSFIADISQLIAARTRVYVSPGIMGGDFEWWQYREIANLRSITANTCHYNDCTNAPWVCLEAMRQSPAWKFFYVGEAGYAACPDKLCSRGCSSGDSYQQRAARMSADIVTLSGADAFLVWQFSSVDVGLVCDAFSIFPGDPVCSLPFDELFGQQEPAVSPSPRAPRVSVPAPVVLPRPTKTTPRSRWWKNVPID